LPNTCRRSSRASPRSKSTSAGSLSIAGATPPAAPHLGERGADVAQRGAERSENLVLLLVEIRQRPDGGAQVHSRATTPLVFGLY
jgi:hypothetical protein